MGRPANGEPTRNLGARIVSWQRRSKGTGSLVFKGSGSALELMAPQRRVVPGVVICAQFNDSQGGGTHISQISRSSDWRVNELWIHYSRYGQLGEET